VESRVALGRNALPTTFDGVAIGRNTVLTTFRAVALGRGAVATRPGEVAIAVGGRTVVRIPDGLLARIIRGAIRLFLAARSTLRTIARR
jgi:hypothetical protein